MGLRIVNRMTLVLAALLAVAAFWPLGANAFSRHGHRALIEWGLLRCWAGTVM